jgi:hypothetical protein
MKLLKHIIAFLLLTLFLLPVVSSAVLQLQQLDVQHQMEEALEKEQLVTINISTASLQWVEKNKECLIDGELFDVKSVHSEGGNTQLTGLFDVKEKAIKAQMSKQAEQEQNNQSKQIAKLLLMVVTPHNESRIEIYLPEVFISMQLYKASFYIAPFAGNLTPPPKNS